MKNLIVATLVLAMSACGGGGSDEEPQQSAPVNCQAKPEACK
jgi:hypothetical protein